MAGSTCNSKMATPTMAHDFPPGYGRIWSLEKTLAELTPRCPSETSSVDFAELHNEYSMSPSMPEIKQTIIEHEQGTPAAFDDRYMSSEEQLSPTEHDSESDDLEYEYDDASVIEVGIAAPLKFTVCDMAVAICVVAAGQPKIVDVSTPMQKSSPRTGRGIGFGRATWMPRTSSMVPRFQERSSARPSLPTVYSVPTLDETQSTMAARTSTTASTAPSTASDTSPFMSSSSATPPTSAYTDSEGHGSPGSFCNTFSTTSNSPPQKSFSIAQSNTIHHSFLEHDPYEHTAPPQHRKHSRFRNLSQKIKLPRFSKSSNTSSDEDALSKPSDKDSSFESLRPVSPPPPRMQMQPMQEPRARRKMVARGAAERAPIIQIPDCPYDVDDDGSLIMDMRLKRRKSFGF